MRQHAWLIALFVGVLALAGAGRLAAQSNDPIPALQQKLANETRGGVFDSAKLLKAGGAKELQTLAGQFERDGLRLWVVTVPAGTSAQVAERLYANLSMTEKDVLVVFNGKQVYGRADALKGEPEIFKKALEDSRRDFNRYWAKGIGTFASILRARILETRREAQQAQERAVLLKRTALGGAAGLVVLLVAWIPFRRRQLEQRAKASYDENLARARQLFTEYGERVVYDGARQEDARFVDFSRRLEACEKSRDYLNPGDLARLIGDLEEATASS